MSTVTKENPFRVGTKLHRIFEYMKDGKWHTLHAITDTAYGPSLWLAQAGTSRDNRRRVASALRTIRHAPKLWIRWSPGGKSYRLEDGLV